jgi:hypothetical protein
MFWSPGSWPTRNHQTMVITNIFGLNSETFENLFFLFHMVFEWSSFWKGKMLIREQNKRFGHLDPGLHETDKRRWSLIFFCNLGIFGDVFFLLQICFEWSSLWKGKMLIREENKRFGYLEPGLHETDKRRWSLIFLCNLRIFGDVFFLLQICFEWSSFRKEKMLTHEEFKTNVLATGVPACAKPSHDGDH